MVLTNKQTNKQTQTDTTQNDQPRYSITAGLENIFLEVLKYHSLAV